MKKKILAIIFWLLFFSDLCFSAERIVVSIVHTDKKEAYNQASDGFKKLFDDKNIALWFFEYNLEGKEEKGNFISEEIKNKKPDIILTIGSLATKVITENIKNIPIVFCMVMEFPSVSEKSNLSGVLMNIPLNIKLETLKKVLPKTKKTGVIYSSKTENTVKELLAISDEMDFKIINKRISSEKELPETFKDLCWQIDVFLMLPDSNIYSLYSIKYIILQCLEEKIPLFGLSLPYTKAGALFSLDCDYEDIGRQAGEVAVKIIRGEKPANIPVDVPRKTRLAINLITAEKIGIEISPDVLKEGVEVFGK